MAAKGYWDAFEQVKLAVERVLNGENAGEVFEATHADWYLALFGRVLPLVLSKNLI